MIKKLKYRGKARAAEGPTLEGKGLSALGRHVGAGPALRHKRKGQSDKGQRNQQKDFTGRMGVGLERKGTW